MQVTSTPAVFTHVTPSYNNVHASFTADQVQWFVVCNWGEYQERQMPFGGLRAAGLSHEGYAAFFVSCVPSDLAVDFSLFCATITEVLLRLC